MRGFVVKCIKIVLIMFISLRLAFFFVSLFLFCFVFFLFLFCFGAFFSFLISFVLFSFSFLLFCLYYCVNNRVETRPTTRNDTNKKMLFQNLSNPSKSLLHRFSSSFLQNSVALGHLLSSLFFFPSPLSLLSPLSPHSPPSLPFPSPHFHLPQHLLEDLVMRLLVSEGRTSCRDQIGLWDLLSDYRWVGQAEQDRKWR
jgi:hypothetical protein